MKGCLGKLILGVLFVLALAALGLLNSLTIGLILVGIFVMAWRSQVGTSDGDGDGGWLSWGSGSDDSGGDGGDGGGGGDGGD